MTAARGYETFDHTADIGIRAWGDEFSDVFEEAAKALFSVVVDLGTVSPLKVRKVTVAIGAELRPPPCSSPREAGGGEEGSDADSGEELFLAWLKELLYIFETDRLVLCEFIVLELTSTHLTAEVRGEVLDNKKHGLGREVKAVTHHQFKLIRDKSRYLAEVILDI